MENTTETELQEQSHHEPEMVLSQEAQYYLEQAGKWASFLAIMGFIGFGILVIFSLFFLFMFRQMSQIRALLGIFMGITYLGAAFIVFFINYRLYQFALNIQRGIAFFHIDMVSKAMQKLHSYLRIKGIMLIIVIALYVLMFITVIATKHSIMSFPGYPGSSI